MKKQLTPREQELLGILQEECSEVIQIISKIRRFGLDSFNPHDPKKTTNQQHLTVEVGDVIAIVNLLMMAGKDNPILTSESLIEAAEKKQVKVQKFLRTPE